MPIERSRWWALPSALLLLAAACAKSPQAVGGVSTDEAQALNEAADMLDINSVAANATDTP